MKRTALLLSLTLAMSLSSPATHAAFAALWASTEDTKEQPTAIQFFDVLEMPLSIRGATLHKTDDGYVLRCSAANRSGEQLTGFELLLMVFDAAGNQRGVASWMEGVELGSYSIKEFSFKPPARLRISDGDNVVLAAEMIIGQESIWRAPKVKNAIKAYASGEPYDMPDVQRVSNRVSDRPGLRALPRYK